jgi:hypothetical protein
MTMITERLAAGSVGAILIAMVLFAMTSCAQLPPSDQVISAMRCPAHPETQFLDPEKFDLGSLASGGCDKRRTTAQSRTPAEGSWSSH